MVTLLSGIINIVFQLANQRAIQNALFMLVEPGIQFNDLLTMVLPMTPVVFNAPAKNGNIK